MSTFIQQLLRLKLQLNVETDREVAEALEISCTGFNERKRRNSFPVDRVYALERRQPSVDSEYVLTGRPRSLSGVPQILIDGGCQAPTEKAPAFNPPSFEEMAAYMDAEMARMGTAQPGAAA